MIKFLISTWQIVQFFWTYVKPIYSDLMRIIARAKLLGLANEEARKQVFQDATDCIQARGLAKVPDSVLNTAIELCYQLYIWQNEKQGEKK